MTSNIILASVTFIVIPLVVIIIVALVIVAIGIYLLARRERRFSRTILVSAFMMIVALFIVLKLVLNGPSPSTARLGSATPTPIPAPAPLPTIAPQLHVAGNQILD